MGDAPVYLFNWLHSEPKPPRLVTEIRTELPRFSRLTHEFYWQDRIYSSTRCFNARNFLRMRSLLPKLKKGQKSNQYRGSDCYK